jgi:predicted PurR-regulated permease PerM
VPAVLLAIAQLGLGPALLIALGYLVVNTILGNIVEPALMGRAVGLSTLVVFVSLVFWGWVWGPVGMLLSVPLTMIVKIFLENSDDLRWMAVLLDSPKAAQAIIDRADEP